MKNWSFIFSVLLVTLVFTNCRNEPKPPPPPEEKLSDEINKSIDDAFEGLDQESEDLKNAIKDVVSAVQKNSNEDVKIVPFRKMKELIPEKLAGLEKVDSEGSTSGMFGMKLSTYEAKYGEGDQRLNIQLIDTGGFGKAVMGVVPWATMEMDKENKDGYEMTTEYKGHKAYEKYNENSQSGSLAVLIDKRFVVNLEGAGISMKQMKRALDDININRLIKLGEEEK